MTIQLTTTHYGVRVPEGAFSFCLSFDKSRLLFRGGGDRIELPPGLWSLLGKAEEITGDQIGIGEDHYQALLNSKGCIGNDWILIKKEG